MNLLLRSFSPVAFATLALVLGSSAIAQNPATPEKSTPAAATPADAPTPAAEAAPAAPAVPTPQAEPPSDDRSKLRRIDEAEPGTASPTPQPGRRPQRRRGGGSGEFPFGDHVVPVGGRMTDVVSIMGTTTVDGEIASDAVSIGGATIIGPAAKVGGAAVAVLGRLESEGEVRGEAVSVLGRTMINGPIGGEAVAVLGNMHLGPKAVVQGDIVVVGGKLTKDANAVVHGNEVHVPMLGGFANMEWLATWVKRCAFYGRPLAFGHDLGWAWAIAFSFLAFYLLLALLFSRGLVKCAETLETRPGFSVLSSVLTVLLTPVAIVLLAITVVGALLVPFLAAGLLFAALFGKAVMLAWIGRRFTKFFGDGPLGHPAFAVLIGGLLVMLLYTVPVLGFLSYKLLSWLGLGVVVYTIALSMKREKRAKVGGGGAGPMPIPATPAPVAPVTPVSSFTPPVVPLAPSPAPTPSSMAMEAAAAPTVSPGFTGTPAASTPSPIPPLPDLGPLPTPPPVSAGFAAGAAVPPPPPPYTPPPAASVPPVSGAVAWPRAGFFIRLGALALDAVLIGLVLAFVSGLLPRFLRFHDGPGGFLIVLALYGALMWKHKGTTIGGIVCGLKVVRVDNRELDWGTAIVRALSCFLSLAVAGLGFIWVAIDDEKQSWHDKIAGTAVVHVPKGVSLL